MPYCQVQETRTYYEEEGQGKPMVLVHGAGQDTLSWRFAIPYLSKKFRTIAVDLPGHGKSLRSPKRMIDRTEDYAHFLNQFIDTLALGKVVLVGHSMAGGCTLLTGLNRPDQILAGVAVDGAGSTLKKAVSYSDDLMDLITVNIHDYWETNFMALCGEATSEEQKRLIGQETQRVPSEVIHGDLRAYTSFDISHRLKEISFPVVLVTGEDDWSCTPENVRRTESLLSCPKVVEVLKGVGHFPHMEAPELFSTTLMRLLSTVVKV